MSGSRQGFAVTITAVDAASKRIDTINKKIVSITAPVERVQRSLAKFADVSGITALGNGFRNLARFALEAFRSIARIIEPLAAITGALSVAGLYKLTSAFADFGSKLGFSAQRMGMSAGALQAFQGAARLSGASAASLTSGMTTLGDTLVDAVGGRAPEAANMLNQLGIAIRDGSGHARTATSVLPQLADKIARLTNPTLQAEVATTLFGGAAEDLLPFLRLGSAGIAAYTEKARSYGVVNEKGVAAANELRMAQTGLTMSVEGLGWAVAEKLAPVLGPVLRYMADWIARNRELVATKVGEYVKAFSDYVAKIDWTKLGSGISDFAVGAERVAKAVAGIMDLQFFKLSPELKSLIDFLMKTPGQAFHDSLPAGLRHLLYGDDSTPGTPGTGRPVGTINPASNQGGFETYDISRTRGGSRGPKRMADIGTLENYFQGQGWTKPQVAGLLANFQGESGFDLGNVGDNGAARGLAQWRDGRRDQYFRMFGHDPTQGSTLEQAQFVQWELTHTEKAAGDALRGATTGRDAAVIVSSQYERPQDTRLNARVRGRYGEDWERELGPSGAPANIGSGTGAAPGSTAQPPTGTAQVNINLRGAPAGTTTTASTTGDLFSGPPRVVTSMPGVRTP